MAVSLQRQLLAAVMTRLQSVTGSNHSGVDLSDADRTYAGRWGRSLPTSPPNAFVYKPGSSAKAANLTARSRSPRIVVDVWHGKASTDPLHLVSTDLEADLLAVFEDAAWLKSVRNSIGLTSLKLLSADTKLFPGHLFAHPDREMVRVELTFSWRTPCT